MPFDSPSDIIFFKRNCLLLSTKPLETHSKCLNFYRCGPISNLHMKCKLNILLILKKGSTNWARRKKPNILSIIQNERKKNRIKDTLFSGLYDQSLTKLNSINLFSHSSCFFSRSHGISPIFSGWWFFFCFFDLFVGHKSHTYIHIVWSCHLDILLSFRLAQEKLW